MNESIAVARTVPLPDHDATVALAAGLAGALPPEVSGWTILLRGELGAGKSTFARALLHAMGHAGAVPSPTYTLVEPYNVDGKKVYHIDLYRVMELEELEFLGWSDLGDGLMLIEWPERMPHLEDDADIVIQLQYDGDARLSTIGLRSNRAAKLAWSMDSAAVQG